MPDRVYEEDSIEYMIYIYIFFSISEYNLYPLLKSVLETLSVNFGTDRWLVTNIIVTKTQMSIMTDYYPDQQCTTHILIIFYLS